jgi:hypothetical protein
MARRRPGLLVPRRRQPSGRRVVDDADPSCARGSHPRAAVAEALSTTRRSSARPPEASTTDVTQRARYSPRVVVDGDDGESGRGRGRGPRSAHPPGRVRR